MKDWLLLALAGLLNGAGSLFLKQSRRGNPTTEEWQRWLSPWLAAGILCYAVNVLVFAKALESLGVSVAYPILAGMSFALISLAAYWFFGEYFGWMQWIGLILILTGIVLLAQAPQAPR